MSSWEKGGRIFRSPRTRQDFSLSPREVSYQPPRLVTSEDIPASSEEGRQSQVRKDFVLLLGQSESFVREREATSSLDRALL